MLGALQRHGSLPRRQHARLAAACGIMVALAMAGAGCSALSSTGNTATKGGVVTYALPPATVPNFILPFENSSYFSTVNTNQFQFLMYRPLYWFGQGNTPDLNKELSPAYPPTYSGQVVTIRLKNWFWSNGEPVDANDVLFFMHMMVAEDWPNVPLLSSQWGGYVQHALPNNVKDIRAVGTHEVQMTIIGKYSRTWFTDNELSQITPMPVAWDLSGAGRQTNCVQVVADCAAVYNYLFGLSKNTATWATNPLWGIVDGPWRLTGYNSQGVLTFTLNQKYSLPLPANHITEFQELPFTSEAAEFNLLQAGGSQTIDVGYLPTVDAPVPLPGSDTGANPVSGYQLQAVYAWELTYLPYNFAGTDPAHAIISEQYFRTALQDLMNQAAVVEGPLHGYGKISTTTVGDYPSSDWLSPQALRGDPFPYNPYAAKQLLAKHGWVSGPGGVDVCGNPVLCGPGVKRGKSLTVNMDYVTGTAWVQSEVQQLISNAAQVGIKITTGTYDFNALIGRVVGDCGAALNKPCPWEIANWGGGWTYAPDYMPTGEELFKTGAAGNFGQYSNPTNNALIQKTLITNGRTQLNAMYNWEKYLTPKLPVMMQPDAVGDLIETVNNLRIGVQAPTLQITPEYWYYVR